MGVDLKLEAVNAKLTDSFSPPIHRYPPPFWGRRPGAGRMPRPGAGGGLFGSGGNSLLEHLGCAKLRDLKG